METFITQLLEAARRKQLKIATVESCTGGLIAKLLTDVAGSSDVFERGFVTYSNEAKHELVGVPEALIETHGAVSEQVACALAEGGVMYSKADIAVSVTGIAGPSGGSEKKPVGLVFIGISDKNGAVSCERCQFTGGRTEIRLKAAEKALQLLQAKIDEYRITA